MLIMLIIRHCILTILYSQLSTSQTLLTRSRLYIHDTFPGSVCLSDPVVSWGKFWDQKVSLEISVV